MRHYIYFSAILSMIFISCQNDKETENGFEIITFDKNQKTQVFNIGLAEDTTIIGEEQTEIHFERDRFNLADTDSVTIILKELYDFDSILFNGISTLTNNNELLETSGVFYLEVKGGERTAELKQNETIQIRLPIDKLSENRIFKASIDTVGRYEWIEEDIKAKVIFPDTLRNIKYGLSEGYYLEKLVPVDSVEYYERIAANWRDIQDDIAETVYRPELNLEGFGWYNIDKFIAETSRIDFKVKILNSKSKVVNIYLIYDDLRSVIFDYKIGKTIRFDSIPYIKNLELIILDKEDNNYFYSKIEVDSTKEFYQTELMPSTLKNLQNEIKK